VLTGIGVLALVIGAQHWLPVWLVYAGLAALLAAAVLNWRRRKKPVLVSRLTCPHCGHAENLRMPTDACLFFWDCPACGQRAKPHAGDCCVFCSYGDIPCPPIQLSTACGC
jgi:LPXTG-motif cell wall-anchored protein